MSKFSFFCYLSISCILTRIILLLFFLILHHFPSLHQQIMYDNWHHYQLAALFCILSSIFLPKEKARVIIAISAGIMLEEWVVILGDLRIFGHLGRYYLSGWDFYLMCAALFGVGLILWKNGKLGKKVFSLRLKQ